MFRVKLAVNIARIKYEMNALACVVVKTMMRAEDCSKSASSDGDAGKHVPERRAGQRMPSRFLQSLSA